MVVVGAHYHNHDGDRCLPRPTPRSPPITEAVADTLKDVQESGPIGVSLFNMAAAPANGARSRCSPSSVTPPISLVQKWWDEDGDI